MKAQPDTNGDRTLNDVDLNGSQQDCVNCSTNSTTSYDVDGVNRSSNFSSSYDIDRGHSGRTDF